jgi:hypothetical protein
MAEADRQALARLAAAGRTAALGTLASGAPYVSLVLYAPDAGLSAFYLHLSRLAVHTRNLQADPRAALMIAQPDEGQADPQTLMRLSLQGRAVALGRQSPNYAPAQACYLGKYPQAAPIFSLPDFDLYRFTPASGRFISAFGKIFDLTAAQLREASAAL